MKGPEWTCRAVRASWITGDRVGFTVWFCCPQVARPYHCRFMTLMSAAWRNNSPNIVGFLKPAQSNTNNLFVPRRRTSGISGTQHRSFFSVFLVGLWMICMTPSCAMTLTKKWDESRRWQHASSSMPLKLYRWNAWTLQAECLWSHEHCRS